MIMKRQPNSTKITLKSLTDLTWFWIWLNSVSNSKNSKEPKLCSTTLYSMKRAPHTKSLNKLLRPIFCSTKFISKRRESSILIQMSKPENKSRLQLSTKNWSLRNYEAKEDLGMSRKSFTLNCTMKLQTIQTLTKKMLKLQLWCWISVWK